MRVLTVLGGGSVIADDLLDRGARLLRTLHHMLVAAPAPRPESAKILETSG